MEAVLYSKENDCRGCYKCIRSCPTKSIAFHHGQASIIKEECVLCGKCYEVCPQSCKCIRSDLERLKTILEGKEGRVIASIAPSFFSAFAGVSLANMKEALLKVGFDEVEETARGATLVKREYDRLLAEGKSDILISTACYSVNLLFEKHYPELLPYLCPVVSPMLAHAKMIKEREPNAKVVFIGPCIAKKEEADNYPSLIDVAITYNELEELLAEKKVTISLDSKPIKEEKSLTRLFPTGGGILLSMERKEDYNYLYVDGMERCLSLIKEIKEGKIKHSFIEMSACEGSCIGGPAMKDGRRSLFNGYLLTHEVAGKDDFEVPSLKEEELKAVYPDEKKPLPSFSEEEIAKVLAKIGKTSKKDELNCSCCGYPSCHDKAIAVLEGKASLEMCLPYLMKKSQSFSNTIVESMDSSVIVLDDDLKIELANPSAAKLLGLSSAALIAHPISEFFDPECFGFALGGSNIHHRKLSLLNSEKIVEGSIVYVSEYHILIAILHDVTKEEKARIQKEGMLEQTAKITSEVIDKNMRAVQEIASLLGETTAETKIALSKLRDVLESEKEDA